MVEWLQTLTLIFAIYAVFNNYSLGISNTDNQIKEKIVKIETRLESIEKTQERLMNRIFYTSDNGPFHIAIAQNGVN